MEDFWAVILGWTPIGQGIFLLIILGTIFSTIFTLIHRVVFYVTVWFKGWPPEHVVDRLFDSEGDEDV